MGTSLDCLGSYNDGFTLSLIWRVMEEALGLGPKGKSGSKKEDKPRVPQSELPRAGKVGTAPPGGDRTRESIRAAKEEHERNAAALKARGETEAAGACCTCVCPPEQGFGQGFNLAPDIAARHPSVKQNDPCPAAVTALFPDAVGLCKPPRYRWHLDCILLKMRAICLPTGPFVGNVQQCPHTSVGQPVCAFKGEGSTVRPSALSCLYIHVPATTFSCSLANANDSSRCLQMCEMVPGSKELATVSCRLPMQNEWQECVWTTGPCEYNPYYPIKNITGAA